MTAKDRHIKNQKIKETMRATYAKRATQTCRTFTFKIDRSKLKPDQKEAIENKLLQAKWLYNYILGEKENIDVFKITYKDIPVIYHYTNKEKTEKAESTLPALSSSEKDGIIADIRHNISALSALKKKGYKVGELKFKTEYRSLYYKQYGLTHEIRGNKIKLMGIKRPIRVTGLKQLEKYSDMDRTCAHLIFNGYDYFISLTCYTGKPDPVTSGTGTLGIDFGCVDTITMSTGEKIDVIIGETDRLKALQRKLSHKKKGSNNYNKTKAQISKEYAHMCNMKNDVSNKFVHRVSTQYSVVVTQDDDFNSWKTSSGKNKAVQYSILGRTKAGLKRKENTVLLEKWFPTSKFCSACGHKHDGLTEQDRIFICPVCGYTEDRDIHAANNMIYYYNRIIEAQSASDAAGTVVSLSVPVPYNEAYSKLCGGQEAAGL